MRKLTDLQQNCIDRLRFSLASGLSKRIMIQAPTAFGKSLLVSRIASGANAKCKRVNVCVPAISLIDQLVESLHKDGLPRVGVIQADHELTDPGAPIQVCSVQTLMNRKIPPADIVLIDEAHGLLHMFAAAPIWGRPGIRRENLSTRKTPSRISFQRPRG